jgi:hypothetical protein
MRMQKRTKILRVLALLGFASVVATVDASPRVEEKARRVQLTGTIKVVATPKPGFRGQIPAPEGKFKMDLIFPEKGGEVLYQQNTVELTMVRSYSFGGGLECRNTLPEAAVKPRPFKVWANLVPEGVVITEESTKKESFGDQFDMIIKTRPAETPITYTTQCENGKPGDVSDFGTSYTQLLLPFFLTQYGGTVWMNRFGTKGSLRDIGIYGALSATVEWEFLETLVPLKNFQYK